MSADGPDGAVTVSPMTELIVRELRLRRFDGIGLTASPRAFEAAAGDDNARHRPPDDSRVERLAIRHSRRRRPPPDLGL
jgi:hypothetical protein